MKTNNLKFNHSVNNNKVNAEVKIRLNDECKNGHQDFAITATFWEVGKSRTDRNMISGGCCHEEILKHFPQFKLFVDLHLCDFNGAPMYAHANGFYHIKKENKEKFLTYYNSITSDQYEQLVKAENEEVFKYLLYRLGIVSKWKSLSEIGISELEKLTENEFLNDSVKSHLEPFTETEIKAFEDKFKNGFYSDANILEREEAKKQEKKTNLLTDLKKRFEAKNLEALQDYEIDRILIDLFLTKSNVIFYKHTNTIVVNWQKNSYDKQYTEAEFKQFLDIAKENKHLKDCIFELK